MNRFAVSVSVCTRAPFCASASWARRCSLVERERETERPSIRSASPRRRTRSGSRRTRRLRRLTKLVLGSQDEFCVTHRSCVESGRGKDRVKTCVCVCLYVCHGIMWRQQRPRQHLQQQQKHQPEYACSAKIVQRKNE